MKNHDFMPKNHIFSNLGGEGAENIWAEIYRGRLFIRAEIYRGRFFFRVDRSLGAKQEGPMIVHF